MSNPIHVEGIHEGDEGFRLTLMKRRDTLEEKRDEIEAERDELQERVDWLDEQIEHIDALLGRDPEPAEVSTALGTDARQGKNRLADAVVTLIRENGASMHYKQIYDSLRGKGVDLPTGKNPATTLLARYYNDPRLYRPKRGTYAVGDRRQNRSVGARKPKSNRRG